MVDLKKTSVKLGTLAEKQEKLKKISYKIAYIEDRFSSIRRNLDWDIRRRNGIDQEMQEICRQLSDIERGLRSVSNFAGKAAREYEYAEDSLKRLLDRVDSNYKPSRSKEERERPKRPVKEFSNKAVEEVLSLVSIMGLINPWQIVSQIKHLKQVVGKEVNVNKERKPQADMPLLLV